MNARKFGSYLIDLDKVTFIQKFYPEIPPPGIIYPNNLSGVRIGFIYGELNVYEDEDGYTELVHWIEDAWGDID
jgi:hypothetical protein